MHSTIRLIAVLLAGAVTGLVPNGAAAQTPPAAGAKPQVTLNIPIPANQQKTLTDGSAYVVVDFRYVHLVGQDVIMVNEGPDMNAKCRPTDKPCNGSCRLPPSVLGVYLQPVNGDKIAPGNYRIRYNIGAPASKSTLQFSWKLKGAATSTTPPPCVFDAKGNYKVEEGGICEVVVSSPNGTPIEVSATTTTPQIHPHFVQVIKE